MWLLKKWCLIVWLKNNQTSPASSDPCAPLLPSVWIQPGDDSPALRERDHAQSQQQESQVGAFVCRTRVRLLYPSVSSVSNPSFAAAAGPKPSCWSCWPPCVSSEADMTSSSLPSTTSRMWEELLYRGSWHIATVSFDLWLLLAQSCHCSRLPLSGDSFCDRHSPPVTWAVDTALAHGEQSCLLSQRARTVQGWKSMS